jgi:hypothetical protein
LSRAPYAPMAPYSAQKARSERHTATLSGAVSVGSNPTGGTGQRHKFEHSDNLEPRWRQACDLRQRGVVPDLVSNACPDSTALSAASPAQRKPAFTVSGPFGDGRPLLLPLVPRLRRDGGHSPMPAKDVPQQSCARLTCQKGTTRSSGRILCTRRSGSVDNRM